ncbi:response regulator [Halonotius roseus]|uniref:Response regulator n=1 Tax=Halonotius roseus TaxID=2511997 RepID=A0A544QPN6_9EURY|nr:response regulator [Halonotius roseus]TQQ81415.1 response regulator [Halonotius roseus]
MSDPDEHPGVLVVDDEQSILGIIELWLGDDYDVQTATNGSDALEALDETVDVVLLDRRMSGLSGDEVLAEIRERPGSYQVALVTAVDPDFDIADLAFDSYVTKPLDEATVRQAVDRLLARATYDDLLQEHYAVAEALATLENEKTDAELSTSEAYQEAVDRFAELEKQVADRSGSLRRDDLVNSMPSHELAADPTAGSKEAADE